MTTENSHNSPKTKTITLTEWQAHLLVNQLAKSLSIVGSGWNQEQSIYLYELVAAQIFNHPVKVEFSSYEEKIMPAVPKKSFWNKIVG